MQTCMPLSSVAYFLAQSPTLVLPAKHSRPSFYNNDQPMGLHTSIRVYLCKGYLLKRTDCLRVDVQEVINSIFLEAVCLANVSSQ